MNDSTLTFLNKTLTVTRGAILRRATSLYCPECRRVERVTDVFPDRTCKLSCGHRRRVANRTDAEVIAYEQARATQRKQISRTNSPSQRLEVTYELEA